MEGRAFLCKLVLGADPARPPLFSCSPIKTETNAILQCTVPWNLCRNRSNHERCTEEKREKRWLAEQAERGGSSGCSSYISAL